MDIPVDIILGIAAALGAWNAFIEKRMHSMYKQLVEKIEDKQEINKTVQKELREQIVRLEDQIVRLEAKIDMLIHLNLQMKNEKV